MRTPASLVRSTTTAAAAVTPAASSSSSAQAAMISIDPDMVVILASLLCALVCLALVARCACHRPSPSATSITIASSLSPRGLKKKAIDALPVTAVKEGHQEEQCAICLADLAAGEELRVLPRCGHSFHIACVDAWLHAHATCPSCRATILDSSASSSCSPPAPPLAAPGRCRRCGAACDADDKVAASASASASSADRDESSFSP